LGLLKPGSVRRAKRNQFSSILTNFERPDAPLFIDTADLRHPKCRAISATSSSLALPSTGGDFELRNPRAITRLLERRIPRAELDLDLKHSHGQSSRSKPCSEDVLCVEVLPDFADLSIPKSYQHVIFLVIDPSIL